MTPERIAELRQLVRDGFDLGRALSDELLDALESAQAEITHVRGIMEAGEKECRHREEQDRVYRTKITILENQIADLKRGGVVVPEEESARMKVVALSCGRHDANGDLLCGSCKHSWREANLEDCDEGCSKGRGDLFFHGEPWVDCPDFASRHPDLKRGGVVPELLEAIVDRCVGASFAYDDGGRYPNLEPCREAERRGFRKGWAELASRLRTTPADRVLGEGEDQNLLRLVDELIRWHGLRPIDKRPDHAAVLVQSIKTLRAQPTDEMRSRHIPADRELGEGQVAVGREELDALRHLLDCARIAAHGVEDEGECDMSSICGAVFACDSLRAQPTQEAAT